VCEGDLQLLALGDEPEVADAIERVAPGQSEAADGLADVERAVVERDRLPPGDVVGERRCAGYAAD
jgi:hypothetical protein